MPTCMNIRRLYLTLLATSIAFVLYGQPTGRQVTHQQLVWFSYANTLTFAPKWFVISEIDERRFRNPDRQHQFLVRSHLHYVLGNNWDASAGFAYFLQSPHDPLATDRLVVPELRPHLQLDYKQPVGRLTITHRYRVEKRFFRNTANSRLSAGYTSNYRFRYRIGLEYRLFELYKQPLLVKVQDEIHVNAGKQIADNRFDQNRIYAGLNYAVMQNFNVEVGYLKWFQQRPTGNQFYDRDILRFGINHKIDLKKKDKAGI